MGDFHEFPLSAIKIHRDDRQRRSLTNIEALADSIRRVGQLHPIVISRDMVLIAGERRYEAVKSLGRPTILCHFLDELPPDELQIIELEENVRRDALPWQDHVVAVQRLHDLWSKDENWTLSQTAQRLGHSASWLSENLSIAQGIIDGDEKILAAKTISQARTAISRSLDRDISNELNEMLEAPPGVITTSPPIHIISPETSILTTSFLDWAPQYSGPKFNLLHCDFPYGIDHGESDQGATKVHGGYDDSPEVYWALCTALCKHWDRLLHPSSHVLFWFSMKWYTETLQFFSQHWPQLDLNPIPLVWFHSDNRGILPDHNRGPRQVYDVAFLGSLGDRKIIEPVANCYAGPTDKTLHASTKPVPMLRHFFRMLVDRSTSLLDPTCGSGSSLRAAEELGADRTLGLEVNPQFAGLARDALRESRSIIAAGKEILDAQA